jgi:hypothetical protein
MTLLGTQEGAGNQSLPARPVHPRGIPPWTLWVASLLAVAFACLSLVQLVRSLNQKPDARRQTLAGATTVRRFWSGIFGPGAPAQIVLDDASLDFYQEALGHPVPLSEYFDRSYLRPAEDAAAAAHLDPKLVHSLLLRRQSNFADVNLLGRLSQTASALGSSANLGFARDFSFRQLKSGNMILLGTRQSNPWIQSFDSYLTLRWKFDPALDSYYPTDITAAPLDADKFHASAESGKTHEGYAIVAFLPNLGGTGNVLIISGSGGAAISAAVEFLNDEAVMSELHSRLKPKEKGAFPYFEILLRVEKGGSNFAKSVTILLSRSPQPILPNPS